MKISVRDLLSTLCLSIVISTAIVWVVIISRGERSTMSTPTPTGELEYDLNLVPPAQLGIEQWQTGDYARYRKTDLTDGDTSTLVRLVDFHIIGELEESDAHRHWMKITGFQSYRHIPTESYRLVTVSDFRLTPLNRSYQFMPNYVPQLMKRYQTDVPQAKLIEIGTESIQTKAGTFECKLYHAVLPEQETILRVWATSKVRPLGIVRVASETEMLELVSLGPKVDIIIPTLLEPVIQGISKLQESCTACHEFRNCHERIFPPK